MAGKTSYKNDWQKNNCERISLVVKKGRKAELQAHAQEHGESLNGFISRAIDGQMERDTSQKLSESPVRAASPLVGIITPDTLKAAQRAAEATGESVSSFIIRVVTEAGVDAPEAARDIADAAGKDVATFTNRTIMEAVKNIESTRKADV